MLLMRVLTPPPPPPRYTHTALYATAALVSRKIHLASARVVVRIVPRSCFLNYITYPSWPPPPPHSATAVEHSAVTVYFWQFDSIAFSKDGWNRYNIVLFQISSIGRKWCFQVLGTCMPFCGWNVLTILNLWYGLESLVPHFVVVVFLHNALLLYWRISLACSDLFPTWKTSLAEFLRGCQCCKNWYFLAQDAKYIWHEEFLLTLQFSRTGNCLGNKENIFLRLQNLTLHPWKRFLLRDCAAFFMICGGRRGRKCRY